MPRTTEVYETSGLSITEFTDTYSSDEATGLTSNEYYSLKKNMLKSVYQNGGF